jgi:hypothetical protein
MEDILVIGKMEDIKEQGYYCINLLCGYRPATLRNVLVVPFSFFNLQKSL